VPLDRWQWHRLDYWDVSKPVARLDFNRKWLTQVKLYKDKLNKLHGLIADKAINTINQDTEHTVVRQFTENLVEEIVDAKKTAISGQTAKRTSRSQSSRHTLKPLP
jgi:hypothetical protein